MSLRERNVVTSSGFSLHFGSNFNHSTYYNMLSCHIACYMLRENRILNGADMAFNQILFTASLRI